MINSSVAAIVVTYNRKDDLITCIEAIRKQTHKVDVLYIIDNKSTDGTPENLVDKGIINNFEVHAEPVDDQEIRSVIQNNIQEDIPVYYVRKKENNGGAGGFYKGMVLAHEAGYDWLWMMDDDGVPKEDQLEILLEKAEAYHIDFANALVVNIKNPKQLAFGLKKGCKTVEDVQGMDSIPNYINPFNGSLITRKLVSDIGFIKKEMFIWGDEVEYKLRAKKMGYEVATVVGAIHYHPIGKSVSTPLIPFLGKPAIDIKPTRQHIYYRNKGYVAKTYLGKKMYLEYLKYSFFFMSRFKFKSLINFHKSYLKGVKNKF